MDEKEVAEFLALNRTVYSLTPEQFAEFEATLFEAEGSIEEQVRLKMLAELQTLEPTIMSLSTEDFEEFEALLTESERKSEENQRAMALEAEVQKQRAVLLQAMYDANTSGDRHRLMKARVALNVFDRKNGYL